jgi:Tfp pilus assembly protein PilV
VFPERLERTGDGALRAYVTFAAGALALAAVILREFRPGVAALYQRAAAIAPDLREALASARRLLAA